MRAVTHEVVTDEGEVVDRWDELGPAEDIEAEPLPEGDVADFDTEVPDLTYDVESHLASQDERD